MKTTYKIFPILKKGYPTPFWIAFSDSHLGRYNLTSFSRTRSSCYTIIALAASGRKKSNSSAYQDSPFEGNFRAMGESKIDETSQPTELQELIRVLKSDSERVGFELGDFCKMVKDIYLQLNSNSNKDLESLVSLLYQHGFLLF